MAVLKPPVFLLTVLPVLMQLLLLLTPSAMEQAQVLLPLLLMGALLHILICGVIRKQRLPLQTLQQVLIVYQLQIMLDVLQYKQQ
jgi:hypothetical protein